MKKVGYLSGIIIALIAVFIFVNKSYYPSLPIGFGLLVAGGVIGIGFGTFQSTAQTVAVNLTSRERIGLATSTYFVFFDLIAI